MISALRLACLLVVAAMSAAVAAPVLTIVHDGKTVAVTDADLSRLATVELEAADHGQAHRYRGVAVRDVLALAGAPGGEQLRGPALGLAVRVSAADGYVAAFALAEFDPAFREQTIVLVNEQDGAPLPVGAGPWRIVCPGDKRGARWVRQVTRIEIVSLAASP